MPIILVGMNHRTASVAVREQMAPSAGCGPALGDAAPPHAGGPAAGLPDGIHESAILATCNRLEMYATAGEAEAGFRALTEYLAMLHGIPVDRLLPHLYRLEGPDAVTHLMRVACGLDSMVLGEPQILGQVAEAFSRAHEAGTPGLVLSQLFTRALHAGKRARAETEISRHTTSVGHAAARLARIRLGDLSGARVLLVGAGDMAELAAAALRAEGAQTFTFLNRTYSRAAELAERHGGSATEWRDLRRAISEADLVVSATGAPHTVIYEEDVARALEQRGGKPLVIVDIALPRDVEPEVGQLPGVSRLDLDDLHGIVDAGISQREAAVPQVEDIIRQETDSFFCWLRSRDVVPVLVEFRSWAESVAQSELELMLRRLCNGDSQPEQLMELLAHRILGKLLHEPTVRLKAEAAHGNGVVYTHALRELFALDASSPCAGIEQDVRNG